MPVRQEEDLPSNNTNARQQVAGNSTRIMSNFEEQSSRRLNGSPNEQSSITRPSSSQQTGHVILVLSAKTKQGEYEHTVQEFSLPLVTHRVEAWCSLRNVWFYKVTTYDPQKGLTSSFFTERHKVDDSVALKEEQLQADLCYLICGYAENDEEEEPRPSAGVSSSSKLVIPASLLQRSAEVKAAASSSGVSAAPATIAQESASSVVVGGETQAAVPATNPQEGTAQVANEQPQEELDPMSLAIKQFSVITKNPLEATLFYLEIGGYDLEGSLKSFYELSGSSSPTSTSVVSMQGNVVIYGGSGRSLAFSSTAPSDFISHNMNNRDLNMQVLIAIQTQDVEKLSLCHSLPFFDFTVRDKHDLSAVHHAAIHGNSNIMNILLKDPKLKNLIFAKEKNYGYTPLHYAAAFGNTNICKMLLEVAMSTDKDYINVKDQADLTPFFYACTRNQTECVKFLIEFARQNNIVLNPNQFDPRTHQTPLFKAVQASNVEMVQELVQLDNLQVGAADIPDCNTPLLAAVAAGNLNIAKLLIEKYGAQECGINQPNAKDQTPLLAACLSPIVNIELVHYLIDKGANTDKPDEDGNTPLLHLIMKDQREIAILLIRRGCDLFAKGVSHKGITALQLACSKGFPDVVEAIALREELDLNLTSEQQLGFEGVSFTPLMNATIEGYDGCVKMLLKFRNFYSKHPEWNVDINRPSIAFQRTALHFAVTRSRLEILKVLVEAGADINQQDTFGMTPAMLAKSRGQDEYYQYLVSKGANLSIRDCLQLTPANLDTKFLKCPVIKHETITLRRETKKTYYPKGQVMKATYSGNQLLARKIQMITPKEAYESHMDIVHLAYHIPAQLTVTPASASSFSSSFGTTALGTGTTGLNNNQLNPLRQHFQKIYGISYFFGFTFMLTDEFFFETNLKSYMKSGPPLGIRLKIACQIACLMAILHNNNVLHKNLRAKAVMLKPNFDVVLGDYGITHTLNSYVEEYQKYQQQQASGGSASSAVPEKSTGASATPAKNTAINPLFFNHVAPEVLKTGPQQFTKASDVYSFGTLLFKLLTGHDWSKQGKVVVEGNVPDEAIQLCLLCLQDEPSARPQSFNRVFETLYTSYSQFISKTTEENVMLQDSQAASIFSQAPFSEMMGIPAAVFQNSRQMMYGKHRFAERERFTPIDYFVKLYFNYAHIDSREVISFTQCDIPKAVGAFKKFLAAPEQVVPSFNPETAVAQVDKLQALLTSPPVVSTLPPVIQALSKPATQPLQPDFNLRELNDLFYNALQVLPKSKIFVVFDLFRMFILNRDASTYVLTNDDKVLRFIFDELPKNELDSRAIQMAIRVLCNILADKEGVMYILKNQKYYSVMLEFVSKRLTLKASTPSTPTRESSSATTPATPTGEDEKRVKLASAALAGVMTLFMYGGSVRMAESASVKKFIISALYALEREKDEEIASRLALAIYRLCYRYVDEVFELCQSKFSLWERLSLYIPSSLAAALKSYTAQYVNPWQQQAATATASTGAAASTPQQEQQSQL